MHYGNIKENDVADGTGVRVSLFVSGCTNHCKGCFQPETWDFGYGQEFTPGTEETLLRLLDRPYIEGLTILGGEPMEPENQAVIRPLLERVKERFPGKTVWMYTGFVLEKDLMSGGRKATEDTPVILSLVDVLVDGPFVEELRDPSLAFRGSSNQRVIDMRATRESGEVTVLPDEFFR